MRTKRTCLVCGIDFIPSNHSSGKYCSQSCYQSVPKRREPLEARFWKYVRKSDHCWEWIGALKGTGRNRYGVIKIATGNEKIQQKQSAHRLSWMLHYGEIPTGMMVCHTCDNPPCVRPDHLFLGTNMDNMIDMNSKGRHGKPDKRGEKHHMVKLTEDRVREIRSLFVPWKKGCVDELASKFGITRSGIYSVVRRITWPHIS